MTYLRTCSIFMRGTLLAAPALALAACSGGSTGQSDTTTTGDTGDTGDTDPSTGDDPTTAQPTDASSTGAVTVTDPTSTSTPATTTATSTGDTSDTGTVGDDSGDPSTGELPGWLPPACDKVTGTGAVTFSFDQGATVAPMDQMIVPVTYTWGLVALDKPGALLAGSKQEILASSDAGCSWHSIGAAPAGNAPAMTLRAAGETRAYGFGLGDPALVRVDDEVITKLGSPTGQDGIVGLGAEPQHPDHLRIGDTAGRLWDSTNAGVDWQAQGVPAFVDSLAYRFAFDPQNLDHVLVGTLAQGVRVSHDGGETWTTATGLGSGGFNGFNLVVSPADGEVVWVEGLDLEDPNEATSRHIYRSEDGGQSFVAVVDADEATLYNGNHLFAHPTDPDLLYFVFGQNFGNYGTDLFRYDHAADQIALTHNMWHDAIIEFMPGDPSVMYLGLTIEPGGG